MQGNVHTVINTSTHYTIIYFRVIFFCNKLICFQIKLCLKEPWWANSKGSCHIVFSFPTFLFILLLLFN